MMRVLSNCRLYLAGYDLSGDMNQMKVGYKAEVKEVTTFVPAGMPLAKRKVSGLTDTVMQHAGLYQAGLELIDDILWSKFALVDEVMSVYPETGAEGEVGYAARVIEAEYAPGAKIGDVLSFNVTAEGDGILLRPTLISAAQLSVSGVGTAFNLGAVAGGKSLYPVMHVLAVEGTSPTLDLVIESDDAGAFASPITRASFAQAAGRGAQWLGPIAGDITDTWWRARWTIGGTNSPKFLVAVGLAIQ